MRKIVPVVISIASLFLCSCEDRNTKESGPGFAVVDLVPVTLSNALEPLINTGANSYCAMSGDQLNLFFINAGNIPFHQDVKVRVIYHVEPNDIEESGVIPPDFNNYTLDQTIKNILFPMPGSCFSSDCNFTVKVDFKDEIVELFEGNNQVEGKCIG